MTVLIGIAAALAFGYLIVTLLLIAWFSRGVRPPEGASAVVLGCKVNGKEPSNTLARRLEKAREYLALTPECLCVLSGGQGPDEETTEAACMYAWLRSRGVEDQRLLKEERAVSTLENLRFSRALLPEGDDRIVIITSGYHGLRALLTARALGYRAGLITAPTKPVYVPYYVLREQAAIFVHCMDGTFLKSKWLANEKDRI